jgi:hypothetical protein
MSTKKTTIEQTDEESVETLEKETVVSEVLLFSQFCDRYATNTDKYIKSFISTKYHGILKTKKDWESILKQSIN